jgi:hypothetical protein
MNVLRDIIILSNNFDDNSIKISQNNIKIDYLIHLYGIKNINFNKDIYIKKQIQFTMNNNSLLYNRMVNINNSLVEMTKERYNKFIYFTNSKIFVKYLYVDQMSRLQKLREMLLYIDPFYSKNCILYSGATLLLFGSTYTNDIDILFYDMSLSEIYRIFGKIIKDLNIDFCYFEDNEYKTIKTKFFNIQKITIHHNNNVIKNIGSDTTIKQNIINFGGIYMFNEYLTKQFYINRFILSPTGSKHYILIDMYSLYTNNNFGFFNTKNVYNKEDLSKFVHYMNKFNKIVLTNISAQNLIKTYCDAEYIY